MQSCAINLLPGACHPDAPIRNSTPEKRDGHKQIKQGKHGSYKSKELHPFTFINQVMHMGYEHRKADQVAIYKKTQQL